MWHVCGKLPYRKIAVIEIPDDARVYVEKDKFKADRLIVKEILKFKDVDDDFWLKISYHHACAFEYVQNQNEEICKLAIQHVKYNVSGDLLYELKTFAVKQNGETLDCMYFYDDDLCTLAVPFGL